MRTLALDRPEPLRRVLHQVGGLGAADRAVGDGHLPDRARIHGSQSTRAAMPPGAIRHQPGRLHPAVITRPAALSTAWSTSSARCRTRRRASSARPPATRPRSPRRVALARWRRAVSAPPGTHRSASASSSRSRARDRPIPDHELAQPARRPSAAISSPPRRAGSASAYSRTSSQCRHAHDLDPLRQGSRAARTL